jgi:hypothetical protein
MSFDQMWKTWLSCRKPLKAKYDSTTAMHVAVSSAHRLLGKLEEPLIYQFQRMGGMAATLQPIRLFYPILERLMEWHAA